MSSVDGGTPLSRCGLQTIRETLGDCCDLGKTLDCGLADLTGGRGGSGVFGVSMFLIPMGGLSFFLSDMLGRGSMAPPPCVAAVGHMQASTATHNRR